MAIQEQQEPMVLGLDGVPQGWIGCLWGGPKKKPVVRRLKSLQDVEGEFANSVNVVAVDIPLGLQDAALPGGRACDREARKFVGRDRTSSVFSPPAQGALTGTDHAHASRLNQESGVDAPGLTKQAFALFPKLQEAKKALEASPWLRDHLIEVHPEVCFRRMAELPLKHSKKKRLGREERKALLDAEGFMELSDFVEEAKSKGAKEHDALDACAAAWTAWRHMKHCAECFPQDAITPSYSMRIWF